VPRPGRGAARWGSPRPLGGSPATTVGLVGVALGPVGRWRRACGRRPDGRRPPDPPRHRPAG